MLGFVLYRLYQSLNLHYPPKIALLSAVDSGIEKDEKEKDITPPQFCLQDNKMEAVSEPFRHAFRSWKNFPVIHGPSF